MPRPVKGTLMSGGTTKIMAGVYGGRIRLSMGRQLDPDGWPSRAVDLDPKDAARIVQQLAKAIADTLARAAKSASRDK